MNRYLILLILLCSPLAQPRAGIVEGQQAFLAGDYERAYGELLPLSLGNPLAAYYVGLMNLDELSSPSNPATGVRWLTLAAQRGHTGAQLRLAIAHENGDVVDQDYVAAAELMTEAAHGGNADAQYLLGVYYRNGQGVIQDDALAFEWIHRSVEYDVSHSLFLEALFYLGTACEWARGVDQDLTEAYKWFLLASSYSTDEVSMHDEAIRALDALRIRMRPGELTVAGRRAEQWRANKQKMSGGYLARTAVSEESLSADQ